MVLSDAVGHCNSGLVNEGGDVQAESRLEAPRSVQRIWAVAELQARADDRHRGSVADRPRVNMEGLGSSV